jgi:hypothetical protein
VRIQSGTWFWKATTRGGVIRTRKIKIDGYRTNFLPKISESFPYAGHIAAAAMRYALVEHKVRTLNWTTRDATTFRPRNNPCRRPVVQLSSVTLSRHFEIASAFTNSQLLIRDVHSLIEGGLEMRISHRKSNHRRRCALETPSTSTRQKREAGYCGGRCVRRLPSLVLLSSVASLTCRAPECPRLPSPWLRLKTFLKSLGQSKRGERK